MTQNTNSNVVQFDEYKLGQNPGFNMSPKEDMSKGGGGNDGGNNRIDRLETKVERLSENVTELRVSFGKLESTVQNLDNKIDKLEKNIDKLDKDIKSINKWIFLGTASLLLGLIFQPQLQKLLHFSDNASTQTIQEIKK